MIYIKAVLALIFVMVLMGLLVLILKRFGRFSGKGKKLFIEDLVTLDSRKKLVMVRHEKRVYLILLGNNSDMIIDYYNKEDASL